MEGSRQHFATRILTGWKPSTGPVYAALLCTLFAANARQEAPATNHSATTPTEASSTATNKPPAEAQKPARTNNVPRATGFIVKPGFKVELVAESPVVASPVAMAFDERGRLFVVENRDYPNRRTSPPHAGRVRLLEDPDGTGLFKSSTVFAENLPMPSGLACFKGGVFVAAAPDLFYLKDSDGNGIAEERKRVLTGSGDTNAPSTELRVNCLDWGPDCRIHGLAAGWGERITVEGAAQEGGVYLGRNDFSFDPFNSRVIPESGSGNSGLAFDDAGRKFISDLNRPLQQVLLDWRYTARNPLLLEPEGTVPILSPATAIFRYSEAAATNQPSGGNSKGKTNDLPLAPAWMSQVRGMTIYRGNLFPTNYYGNAFIPDAAAGVIHRVVLREADGLRAAATRAPEETRSEFLVSREPEFRPMQVICGPDGGLYIADFREGGEGGRIYRVVPEGFQPPPPPQLDKAKTPMLASLLGHTNGWYRETAARLLIEQQEPTALLLLSNALAGANLNLARLGALNLLGAGGAIKEPQLIAALRDRDERVRAQAVRLAEVFIGADGRISDALWATLVRLGADPSARVRFQLALTAGMVNRPDRTRLLSEMARRDLNSEWFRRAVLSSTVSGGGDLLISLSGDARVRQHAGGAEMLRQLALMIGTRGHIDEVSPLLPYLRYAQMEPIAMFGTLAALGEGLRRTGSSLALVDPDHLLLGRNAEALVLAGDTGAPEAVRLRAIRLLGVGGFGYSEVSDVLLMLAASGQSAAVQIEALRALAQHHDPSLASSLFARWSKLSPAGQTEAIGLLIRQNQTLPAVLGALQDRKLAPQSFSSPQINYLRTHPEPVVQQAAIRFFGEWQPLRPAVVEQFQAALRLKGVASRGRQIFLAKCAVCHQVNGEGTDLGPSLASAKTSGQDRMLASILEPNVKVGSRYEAHVATMRDGENVIGILKAETESSVVIDQPGRGRTVLPRGNVIGMQANSWSLMPEGLEQGMTTQGLADLLAYLMSAAQW